MTLSRPLLVRKSTIEDHRLKLTNFSVWQLNEKSKLANVT